jgi:hypothetical protein
MLHNSKIPDLSWFPHRCAMSLEVGHTEDEQQLALETMSLHLREELRQTRWDVSKLTDSVASLKREFESRVPAHAPTSESAQPTQAHTSESAQPTAS